MSPLSHACLQIERLPRNTWFVVQTTGQQLHCELCRSREQSTPRQRVPDAAARKLRILCLHGFRQTGASLKARLFSFAEAVSDIADLVFIDGPHALPFLYKPLADGEPSDSSPDIRLHQVLLSIAWTQNLAVLIFSNQAYV